jgi:hypothetical protein
MCPERDTCLNKGKIVYASYLCRLASDVTKQKNSLTVNVLQDQMNYLEKLPENQTQPIEVPTDFDDLLLSNPFQIPAPKLQRLLKRPGDSETPKHPLPFLKLTPYPGRQRNTYQIGFLPALSSNPNNPML